MLPPSLHRVLPLVALGLGLVLQFPAHKARAGDKEETKKEEEGNGLFVFLDDAGKLHVVSSMSLVPAPYRARARPVDLSKGATVSVSPSPREARASQSTSRRRRRAATPRSPNPRQKAQQRRTREQNAKKKQAATRGTSRHSENDATLLKRLRAERAEAVDTLGALEEGWLDDKERKSPGDEPSREDLERRAEELGRTIDQLDRRIADLEQGQKQGR